GDFQGEEESDTVRLTVDLSPISGAGAPQGLATPQQDLLSASPTRGRLGYRFPSTLGNDLFLETGLAHRLSRSGSRSTSQRSDGRSSPGPVRQRVLSEVHRISSRVVNITNDQGVAEVSAAAAAAAEMESIPLSPMVPPATATTNGTLESTGGERDGFDEGLFDIYEQKAAQGAVDEGEAEESKLRGKSLGIFGPDSSVRNWLCNILLNPITEPFLFCVIVCHTVLLIIKSSLRQHYTGDGDRLRWGQGPQKWLDFAFLGIFGLYTLECVARIVVSGVFINPPSLENPDKPHGLESLAQKVRVMANVAPSRSRSMSRSPARPPRSPIGMPRSPMRARAVVRTNTSYAEHVNPTGGCFKTLRELKKAQLARRAYLRHSFNRLDFVAVVAYWIGFLLSVTAVSSEHHIYVFKMLSCLRILKLLNITQGTMTILQSLKKAAPLLVNVAFLVGFFWLIFGIVGVQSFKGSFRRQCVYPWTNDSGFQQYETGQYCGGHFNLSSPTNRTSYLDRQNNTDGHGPPKGYLCPAPAVCVESDDAVIPTVSFDNIFQSMELVFVVISMNTWSDLMYYSMNSDYLVSAVFFIAGIVILTFWLMNLVIAVITTSFQLIREEGQRASAFTNNAEPVNMEDPLIGQQQRPSRFRTAFQYSEPFWLLLIAIDIVFQATRTSDMSDGHAKMLRIVQSVLTVIFAIEIVLRFIVTLPNWRQFFRHRRNNFDAFLAAVTIVILFPPIYGSKAYDWLSVFQLARSYRIVLGIPVSRDLLVNALGNASGLINLIFFLLLMTLLASLFAIQLVRGDMPPADDGPDGNPIDFATMWNAFLGMYQIVSTENWTQILYAATQSQVQYGVAWISAAFFIAWFIFGSSIILNMFIAALQENFHVSEEEKRRYQISAFIEKSIPALLKGNVDQGNFTLASLFKRRHVPGDARPEAFNMLMKEAVVKDFLDDTNVRTPGISRSTTMRERPAPEWYERLSKWFKRSRGEPAKRNPFYQQKNKSQTFKLTNPQTMAQDAVLANTHRRLEENAWLQSNPDFDVALWILPSNHPIRHFCQSLVAPAVNHRHGDSLPQNPVAWYMFSAFVYAAIVAMVVIACVTTPLYQKLYKQTHGSTRYTWYTLSDMAFAGVFSIEAAIKIIADGFWLTPNGYFRSTWNKIDLFVLCTIWINVAATLTGKGELSRAFRAFKALRALRLVNVSDTAREIFHHVMFSGFWGMVGVSVVSLGLLIPFAIWGVNIFSGLLYSCNDGSADKFGCVAEYVSSPYTWDLWAPRVWANPYVWSFDSFGASLLILFEIVSLEGWINVMQSAMQIVGNGKAPATNASSYNAIFFVAFNLLGAVFILTLFISVILKNYAERSGVAYLTADQRSWLELRKILRQTQPSKRPAESPTESWKAWCYARAVSKHGYWTRIMTLVYIAHTVLLMTEHYPAPDRYDTIRNAIFTVFIAVYLCNIAFRIIGLRWANYRRNYWNLYDLVITFGTAVTTLSQFFVSNSKHGTLLQFQKLFLVGVCLNLIPKSDNLDQLFKMAAASLPTIGNLIATWCVLFVAYAIAFTQIFGLTRIGPNGSDNINFRTVPKALILLFRMSTGEGWNSIMHDYAVSYPNCILVFNDFANTDCGSKPWAYALFISWNIISMYIFVNMFVVLVVDNFSYVYQRSGKISLVSRDELRRYKDAWRRFDKKATGYIQAEDLSKFLRSLSGVFDTHIYEDEFSVQSMLAREDDTPVTRPRPMDDYDADMMSERITALPIEKIQRRRRIFNMLYAEALITAKPGKGIGFTAMLVMLAHYKVVNDEKSLSLEDYLKRRAKMQKVEEQMKKDIVRGFFQTLYWKKWKKAQLHPEPEQASISVPQIFV
ncbi:hypothetical protein SAICODRAFT_47407, partial [Saitoella complicata NRRL Y-17804]